MNISAVFFCALVLLEDICTCMEVQNSTKLDIFHKETSMKHSQDQELDKSQDMFCSSCLKPKTFLFGCVFLLIVSMPIAALFIVKQYYARQKGEFPYKHFEEESAAIWHEDEEHEDNFSSRIEIG
eukprot:GFUD01003488.1.p1 GENE.GFUD01003488.1~~GFUD01003488.1.p1  ORF type:complete len:125 (+),score=23.41 GFUD01003488.1:140-514(+)